MVNRISIKFFVDDEATTAVDLPGLIPVFHRWIREQLVPGLPIDVANYSHVPNGPGVILVGHEADYGLDVANGRFGLRTTTKREWPSEALADRLRLALQRALHAMRLLQAEPEQRYTFRSDEFELALPDRLHAPNDAHTFAAVRAAVAGAVSELFAGADPVVTRVENDPRQPLTLRVQVQFAEN